MAGTAAQRAAGRRNGKKARGISFHVPSGFTTKHFSTHKTARKTKRHTSRKTRR